MFIQNKYKKWYDSIIASANLRSSIISYSEKHHIIPRSLGGSDDANNLVSLSAREHFVCHVLLTKFTIGVDKQKMLYAANMMSNAARAYQDRYINSRLHEMLKSEFGVMHSNRLKGRKLSEKHKSRISEAGKGRFVTQETINKRILANTGRKRTIEQRERMRQAQLTRKAKTLEEQQNISLKISKALKGKSSGPKTDEHKVKLSLALKGKSSGPKSEETKAKMRKPKSVEHRKAISEARIKKYKELKSSS
jgi:5-methylcytosine-specific restriction endonuclease McrA